MVATNEYTPSEPSDRHRPLILEMQIKLLTLLIEHPGRVVSTDDVTPDLAVPRPGGGQWCGSVTRLMSEDGVIRWTKAKRSTRLKRRKTILGCWKAAVGVRELRFYRERAVKELANLTAGLDGAGRKLPRQATIDDLVAAGVS